MKKFYVLQDVLTKEYYWMYRTDSGFALDLSEARVFGSIDQCEEFMRTDAMFLDDVDDRVIEIKTYYK